MQKALLVKAILVGAVFVMLLIPLMMIDGVVAERQARRQAAAQEVAASSFGRQMFLGLVLSLPYVEEFDDAVDTGRERKVQRKRIERMLHFFPATGDLTGKVLVGEKRRGLFRVRTFRWEASVRGEFVLDGKARVERTRADSHIVWGPPMVSLGLGDPRGLVGAPALEWAGRPIALERGSGIPTLGSGLHASVPAFDPDQPQQLSYALAVRLQGTEALSIVPSADDNRIRLESDWPHPSFGGQFLPQPDSQRVDKDGFSAQWTVTALGSNAQQQLMGLLGGKREALTSVERIDVGFIEPIDIYALSDRALKYGFLFIGLTFGCCLLFEVLKRLPIHPAQYALIGVALATFFLLLIALSEHVMFGVAYLVASSACIGLLGFYLRSALGSARRGVSFALMLTALYGALYGLLVSEDNALLLGALLIFGLVAAAMVLTRKVDWYRVGTPAPMQLPPSSSL